MSSFRSAVVLAAAVASLSCGGKDVVCHGEGCTSVDPVVPSAEVIYDDALAPHWQTLAPWGDGCRASEQTFVVHSGTRAIHLTAPANDYPGVWIAHSDAANWTGDWHPTPVADFRAFRAWIRITDAAAIPDMSIELGDGQYPVGASVVAAPYLTSAEGDPIAAPQADVWYELVVPMADFHAASGATFVAISLGFFDHAVDVYLDDIRLELAAAAP